MPQSLRARWIDLGDVAPRALHAAYMGLAASQAPDSPPLLLWGRSGPHLSLGASQEAVLELDPAACRTLGMPWVRRSLGGGTVLVDGRQYSFFFVLPRAFDARRPPLQPQALFEFLAPAIVGTYRALGLPATAQGRHDFWVSGRKIAGTGSGLLGPCQVFASSFMLDFDAVLFARLVAAPSAGFRAWLAEALAESMTSWRAEGSVPAPTALAAALRAQVERHLGWRLEESAPTPSEAAAMAAALDEVEADEWEAESSSSKRRVPYGIKVKADTYLTERHWDGEWVRILTRAGRIARVAGAGPLMQAAITEAVLGCRPTAPELEPRLRCLGPAAARHWAERIRQTAHVEENG
ncbi:MAG: lipoate--protein ligase family protein [Pseudomonadota bacterium]